MRIRKHRVAFILLWNALPQLLAEEVFSSLSQDYHNDDALHDEILEELKHEQQPDTEQSDSSQTDHSVSPNSDGISSSPIQDEEQAQQNTQTEPRSKPQVKEKIEHDETDIDVDNETTQSDDAVDFVDVLQKLNGVGRCRVAHLSS